MTLERERKGTGGKFNDSCCVLEACVRVREKTRLCTCWRRRSQVCVRKSRSKMISLSALFSGLLSWGPPAVLGERKMTRVVSIRCEDCIENYPGKMAKIELFDR